jgi:hypothetical protein
MEMQRIMGKRIFVSTWCALFALGSVPAAAHHGWAANEQDIEVTGTVESGVSLSGPHGTMQIRDGDGQLWDLTLAPAPRTHRAGLREDTIPMGAEVTVSGQRNSEAERHEIKVRQVIYDGRQYDPYPPRRD